MLNKIVLVVVIIRSLGFCRFIPWWLVAVSAAIDLFIL